MRLITSSYKVAIQFLLLVALILSLSVALPAKERYDLNAEMPISYFIEVKLDTTEHMLTGRQDVRFFNPSDKDLDVLIFHLYPNAFRDTTTLMARESDLMKSAIQSSPGYIDCDSIYVDNLPADSVRVDQTLLYIYPHYKLRPDRIAEIAMNFTIKIPSVVYRFGYDRNGNYLIAHWYPIMVGFQKGEPQVFQYGAYGEFFSNFSGYEINLTLPENFRLGSTSNINTPDSSNNGETYYTLKARDVIDFAFVCGPSWEIDSFFYNNVAIDIFYLKESAKNLPIIRECLKSSLGYFNDLLYPYPYPNFTCVDFNSDNAGLELPRMIIVPLKGRDDKQQWNMKTTLIHETAHQWFYSTIASNEFNEAWLDEGFATYLTGRAMEKIYGESVEANIMGLKISLADIGAMSNRLYPPLNPIETSSESFFKGYYFPTVYWKASITIKALESIMAISTFDEALKNYAQAYRFKHPDSNDLLQSFEKSSGLDLNWFFDSYIYGTDRVDYEVSSIKTATEDSLHKATVMVTRNYEGVLPQDLIVSYRDGTFGTQHWDGKERYREFKFESSSPVEWAAIDTGYSYLLDEDFANNSLKISPETSKNLALTGTLSFLIQLLLLLAGVI